MTFPKEKLEQLTLINDLLHITKHNHHKIVFVYSAPKVGSTSIVSSLRIFAIKQMDIIHIHDEEMLKVLTKNQNITITINELILHNVYLGKEVYVINVYRSPIERKISTYFEKIGSHHFNAIDEDVNTYNLSKVISRFNNIFPWIANGDHFMDTYNITRPDKFDVNNKYLSIKNNGITYITLRLSDSNEWNKILTNLFGFPIRTIKDYESSNKPIKDIYIKFKNSYNIPTNLLNDVMKDTYFQYYYSVDEIAKYYNNWLAKSVSPVVHYNREQYDLYEQISIENCHIDKVQLDHYFDEGCICKACCIKRCETVSTLLNGNNITTRIIHKEATIDLINKRTNKINNIRLQHMMKQKKQFKNSMASIVMK
jgi:hypothetical protein